MPDLLDDGLIDDRLIDDLRRYGATVEAMADRYASPPDYPVEPADTSSRWGRRPPRPTRRRTAVLLAAAAVVLVVVVAAVAVAGRTDDPGPVVDTSPSTAIVPTAQPFDDGTVLMWLPYEESPQYLPPFADRRAAGDR